MTAAQVAMAMRRAIVNRRSRSWSASWRRTNAIGESSTADTQMSVVHPGATAGWVIVRLSNRASADVLAQERDVVLSAFVGGFADHWRVRGLDHRNQQFRVDLSGAEVRVPIGAGTRGIARVVAVHQVDAAGKRLDAIHRIDQRFARCPGMAGGEAERR